MDILDDMGVSKLSAFFFKVNYSFNSLIVWRHVVLYSTAVTWY